MKNIINDERLSKLNHSCAHLLAQAVKHLYPDALFWVGPVIEEGFYYDIDLNGKTINRRRFSKDRKRNEKNQQKMVKELLEKKYLKKKH